MTWDEITFFEPSEFDSPDSPGSGFNGMELEFVAVLDRVRERCGFPFRVNSGFRTQDHHNTLSARGYKTAANSPHLRGWAADIHATTSRHRWAIVAAALAEGITRVGIAESFVHLDTDPTKIGRLLWVY